MAAHDGALPGGTYMRCSHQSSDHGSLWRYREILEVEQRAVEQTVETKPRVWAAGLAWMRAHSPATLLPLLRSARDCPANWLLSVWMTWRKWAIARVSAAEC